MSQAFLFPGLVPTAYAKARPLIESCPQAVARLDEASAALGFDLHSRYAETGEPNIVVYQTAFLALGLGVADWAREELGVSPPVVCGQSYGGFLAAVTSGCLPLYDMVRLLTESIEIEEDYFASLEEPVACTFFYGIPAEVMPRLVREATEDGQGWAEISVQQDHAICSVSGTRAVLERVAALVRRERGLILHTTDRAEHCSRMAPLRERLASTLYSRYRFADPQAVFVSDTSGRVARTGDEVYAELLSGWDTPVVMNPLFGTLRSLGVTELVVPGPRGTFARTNATSFRITALTPSVVTSSERLAA